MNKVKRDYNIDLLRILAAFMVVLLHVSAQYWGLERYNTLYFNIFNIYDSLVRSSVPIFFMISGIFFLSKKEIDIKKLYFKNILKLIILFIIFSLIYELYFMHVRGEHPEFIETLISGPLFLWYIPAIIGLYVISPILAPLAQNIDKKIYKYFCILFFISTLLKTIGYLNFIPYLPKIISNLPIDLICNYYSYFIIGFLIYKFNINEKIRKKIYILAILSPVLCSICTTLLSWYNHSNQECFYNYFSVFTFFEAIGILLYFKNTNFISEKIYSKKIYTISKCTLGVYLVHPLIIYIFNDFNIINIYNFSPILSVPIISILAFIISLLIVYIYLRIINKIKKIK